jgi:hypothetical protein
LSSRKRKVEGFVVDETMLKIGSETVWHWVAIEVPVNKEILLIRISKEETCLWWLSVSCTVYKKSMESILFRLMVEHGIPKHVIFLN